MSASNFLSSKLYKENKIFCTQTNVATNSIAKEFCTNVSDKDNPKTFGFRYALTEGRMSRIKVPAVDKNFKTDGVNSFTSLRKLKIRIGNRPQHYRKPPEPASSFFHMNKTFFLQNEVDLDKAVIVDGCFDTNREVLQRTAIPEVEDDTCLELPSVENIKPLKKAIKATIRKLRIELISSPRFDDVLNCKFNKDTKPGFCSEHILKHKSKQESIEDSYLAAKLIWNRIEAKAKKVKRSVETDPNLDKYTHLVNEFLRDTIPGSGLYDIGARSKRDLTYEDDEMATSRAVHMPEFHNEIVMSPWVDSITRVLKNRKSGPIYIGNSIADFIRYEKDMKSSKNFLEGDWKQFDSTLYARLCIVAISILRMFYSLEDIRADAFFLFMIEKLIIKDYYIPGGRVVRMIHGLPSGTKCTNLLGSVINLLALNYCVEKYNNKNFSFAVGGDDFVIFCRENLADDSVEEIMLRSIQLGMKFKVLEIKDVTSKKLDDFPFFYKYTVRDGKPFLKPKDVLQRVFIPWNKNYNSSLKYLNFLEDQFPQLGYPNAGLVPFYSIYCNMCRRVFKDEDISIGKVYEKHRILYNKYSNKIFHKSISDGKDEIFTFLKTFRSRNISLNVKILLGFYSKLIMQFTKFN